METLKKICSGLRNDEITSYQASKMLEAYIRLHSSMPSLSKFDFFKYVNSNKCSKDHPLNGVYFEDGYKIACNGHAILKLKDDYSKEFEGQIIRENGEFIDSKYVNYKSVLPTIEKNDEEVLIDINKLSEKVVESKMNKKVLQIKDKDTMVIKIYDQFYKTYHIELLVNAYKKLENPKVYMKMGNYDNTIKNIVIKGDNGIFMLMAMLGESVRSSNAYNIVEY